MKQAKKVVNIRIDHLVKQLSDPRVFFSFKSCFKDVEIQKSSREIFSEKYKCRMSVAPSLRKSAFDVSLSVNLIDDNILLMESKDSASLIDLEDIMFLDTSQSLPAKTIVYSCLVMKGKLVSSYKSAKKQAEYMFMGLQLLDDIVNECLDLRGGQVLPEGSIPKGYNFRMDIEARNDPRYNETFDVKHFGFLKGLPAFEKEDGQEPDPNSVIQLRTTGTIQSARRTTFEEKIKGYKIGEEGGVICVNPAEIQSQEGILTDVAARFGKSILAGTGVSGVSLPVRIFEPRTALERILGYWAYMPYYLRLAADTGDLLERMKYACMFSLSGYWSCCGQKKPFQPILGETLQGFWEDGTSISMEYTNHIPPICHFFFEDVEKRFRFYGHHEFKIKLSGATVVGQNYGPNVVEFNDGSALDFYYPVGEITGVMFGTRNMCYTGAYIVRYPAADMEALIELPGLGKGTVPNEVR